MYEANSYWIQNRKPSWILEKDGRVVQVDPYGNNQLHEQQYRVGSNVILSSPESR